MNTQTPRRIAVCSDATYNASMHLSKPRLAVTLAAFAVFVLPSSATAQRPADFGQQWVRSHPFTLMGLQQAPQTFDVVEHRAANMTNVLAWWADGNGKQIAAPASAGNLPWHALIVDGKGDERDRITDYASVGNSAGWMLGNEVDGSLFQFYADLNAWVKQNRPNDLVYTNALPTYAGFADYSGYLEQVVGIMKPDVLMYDHYPFVGTSTTQDYFQNMMLVRGKALQHNLPYWAFMQSSALGPYRLPSKSDARMQMFSHLTAGFTGMAFFTFDNEPSFESASILDSGGNPTSLYPIVADLNKEAGNLGKALRLMTSTDVKYIAGQHPEGTFVAKNSVPLGMTDWNAATDPDDHILAISITQIGLGLDGLIGVFTDDNGDDAFMVTNVYHGPGIPAESQFALNVRFDATVQSVIELDRLTGQQVALAVPANHVLSLVLPAGTGRLFKYNEGDFLVAPVPEPVTIGLCLGRLLPAILGINGRKRRAKLTRTAPHG